MLMYNILCMWYLVFSFNPPRYKETSHHHQVSCCYRFSLKIAILPENLVSSRILFLHDDTCMGSFLVLLWSPLANLIFYIVSICTPFLMCVLSPSPQKAYNLRTEKQVFIISIVNNNIKRQASLSSILVFSIESSYIFRFRLT